MKLMRCMIFILICILFTFSIALANLDMINASINGDIVSWDPVQYDGTVTYKVKLDVYNFGSVTATTTGTSVNLRNLAKTLGTDTATCDVRIMAEPEDVAYPWQGTYNYVAENPKLDAPTNVTWNGMIVTWDLVDNAESYQYILFDDEKNKRIEIEDVGNTNQIDFSENPLIKVGYTYRIYIKAKAFDYPTSDMSDYARMFIYDESQTAIPDVELNGSILSWGHYSRSNQFMISLDGYKMYNSEAYTADLDYLARAYSLPSGQYTLRLCAITSPGDVVVSEVWEGLYTYVALNDQLPAPTNLRWDGKVARWDAVPHAETYDLWLFIYPNTTASYHYSGITTNYYDFTDDPNFNDSDIYFYILNASATDYPTSEFSEQSPNYQGGNQLGNLQNVEVLDDGTITWDAYVGADDYYYDVNGTTGYTGGTTSINFLELVDETETEVNVSIIGGQRVSGIFANITNPWQRTIHITRLKKGDVDENGIIDLVDVRLLLQAKINAGDSQDWTAAELFKMDIDGNEVIDLIDVRLLLQSIVNV